MKKLGSNLTTGDVVTRMADGPVRLLVVGADSISELQRDMFVVSLQQSYPKIEIRYFQPAAEYEVEAPTLTPAQVHADELVGLVREAAVDTARITPAWFATARKLLAKIDPPAPPTLTEALEALLTLADGAQQVGTGDWEASQSKARALLDRARAAGVL